MKTLGFQDRTIFNLIMGEAAIITLGGGLAGALLAKWAIESTGFNAGGLLPPMTVSWTTIAFGIGAALVMGIVSGVFPASQAARLTIVDALRRVE
jgi:putative ABC transport system permease protein